MTNEALKNLRVEQSYEFTKITGEGSGAPGGGSGKYERVRLSYECVLESDPIKYNDVDPGYQEVETLALGISLGAEIENLDVKTRLDLVAVAAAGELSGRRARYDLQIHAPSDDALGVVIERTGELSLERLNELTDAIAAVQAKLSEAKNPTGATRYRRVARGQQLGADLATSLATMYAVSRIAQGDALDKETLSAAEARKLSPLAVEATYLAYGLAHGDAVPGKVKEKAQTWLALQTAG